MIVAPLGEELLLITQGDHAHLSGELFSLFALPELVDHPRRDRLIRAIREHDNGWREPDAAPRIDPDSGEPQGFRRVEEELRREVWSRACTRWRHDDPYVALLITLHALCLHSELRARDNWGDWLDTLESMQSELLEEASLSLSEATADHTWLQLADACSLAVCERRGGSFQLGPFQGRAVEDTLHLEPFPLAGRTTFYIPCRRIPRIRYGGDRELGRALVASRWERRAVRLAP